MTNCEELKNIVNNPDEENLKIEFKNSHILKTNKGKKKIAKEIVSFANKYGGKLILGINKDRSFEGKNIFNVDIDKGKIVGIIRDRISPNLNCEIEFLPCIEGDVIVINTPKRKDMPNAVVKKSDGKIINRGYYTRTSHGIRDVSDKELQYLFKEEKINFSYPFKIVINYIKDSLRIPPLGLESPSCIKQYYLPLIEKIPNEILESIKSEFDDKFRFFMEITPYILLMSFTFYFKYSWLIEVKRHNGQRSSRAISTNVPKKRIQINELPTLPNDSILSKFSIDIREILDEVSFREFFIPINMDLNIFKKKTVGYEIIMEHEDFKFIISFNFDMWGLGLDQLHPRRATYLNQYLYEGKENINDQFEHIQFDCKFNTEFKFPENNPELFDNFYHYAKTIKDILLNEWDYQKYIKKLPHHLLYSIDLKLKDISNYLQNKK